MNVDAIVVGAGPAGLGAALALVRSGARVALLDGAERVGGMSVTVRRGDVAFDLGGHILFVHDGGREAWLRELLGPALRWVDRPVASVDGTRIMPGRYLDRRADGLGAPPLIPVADESAAAMLAHLFGADLVDRHMRPYLEKVDGMPLEAITAARARKLLVEQYAPEGFWFPAGGVGQLMEAMARAIRAGGGTILTGTRVTAIRTAAGAFRSIDAVDDAGSRISVAAPTLIGAVPPPVLAGLVDPPMPDGVAPDLPPRAAAIVVLQVEAPRVVEHAWIQVDRPDVPFARLAEMGNWSAELRSAAGAVMVCEVYCSPTADDALWGRDDAALAHACARALVDPLGLIAPDTRVRAVDVVRLPRAWSLIQVADAEAALGAGRWLDQIDGVVVAQGGDVMTAIAAGEHAAAGAH